MSLMAAIMRILRDDGHLLVGLAATASLAVAQHRRATGRPSSVQSLAKKLARQSRKLSRISDHGEQYIILTSGNFFSFVCVCWRFSAPILIDFVASLMVRIWQKACGYTTFIGSSVDWYFWKIGNSNVLLLNVIDILIEHPTSFLHITMQRQLVSSVSRTPWRTGTPVSSSKGTKVNEMQLCTCHCLHMQLLPVFVFAAYLVRRK